MVECDGLEQFYQRAQASNINLSVKNVDEASLYRC